MRFYDSILDNLGRLPTALFCVISAVFFWFFFITSIGGNLVGRNQNSACMFYSVISLCDVSIERQPLVAVVNVIRTIWQRTRRQDRQSLRVSASRNSVCVTTCQRGICAISVETTIVCVCAMSRDLLRKFSATRPAAASSKKSTNTAEANESLARPEWQAFS